MPGILRKAASVLRRHAVALALGLLLFMPAGAGLDASWSVTPTLDVALAASPRGEAFVVARSSGLCRSADRGLTWTAVGPQGFIPTAVLAGPANAPTFYAVGADGTALRSQDAGVTWSPLPAPPIPGGIAALAVERHEDALMAVTTGGALLRSVDGGETWQVLEGRRAPASLRSLAIDPAATEALYGIAAPGELLRSSDGGLTWGAADPRRSASTDRVHALVARYGGAEGAAIRFGCGACGGTPAAQMTSLVYALQGATLYYSFDQGESWSPVAMGSAQCCQVATLAVDPVNEDRLYATLSQGGGLVESIDGGRSWRHLADGTPCTGEK